MRSLAAPNAAWAGAQVLSVVVAAFGLLWLLGALPAVYIFGAIGSVLLALVFLRRPDVGLLTLLVARATSDATLGTFALAVGTQARLLARLLNPNAALILVLIVAGGIFLLTRGLPFLSLPAGQVYALLLLMGLVGVLRSESLLFGLNEWLPPVSALIVYALAANLFRSPSRVQRAVDIFGVSFLVPAFYGFYQLWSGIGRTLSIGVRRIQGTFAHPNPYGVYLMIIFAIFLCQAFAHRGWRRVVSLTIALATSVLMLGTYTRSVWIGALIILLVVATLQHRRLLLGTPLVLFIVLRGMPSVGARLEDPLAGSFANRLSIWQTLIDQWTLVTSQSGGFLTVALDRLTGLGPGAFAPLINPEAFVAPHNDYLRVLAEYGVLGFIFLVIVYLLLIRMAYQAWRHSTGATQAVALAFLGVAVAFPVLSLTDNLFAMTVNQVYFWTLAGLTAGIGMMAERSAQTSPKPVQQWGDGRR